MQLSAHMLAEVSHSGELIETKSSIFPSSEGVGFCGPEGHLLLLHA